MNHVRSPQNQDSGQVELSEVTDELGRFRIWAGSIGAHRKGRSSLDYRLRDASHIKKKVQTLLEDLNDVISREPDSDSDVTDSESEDGHSQGETELRQLMISLHDTTTFLLRLSMAIRNPAPHDQYMNSARIDTSHFEGFDVKHVGDKFPRISERVAVILGKAISRRREYFRYRESHNKKLSDGLVTEVPEAVLQSGQSAAPEANQDSKTEIVPQSTVASSIPQEVKADNFYLDLEEDQQSESGFTQTSFATSAGGFQELKVPPMPKEARDGNPFPCPFCFMIISVGTRIDFLNDVMNGFNTSFSFIGGCGTVSKDVRESTKSSWLYLLCQQSPAMREMTTMVQMQRMQAQQKAYTPTQYDIAKVANDLQGKQGIPIISQRGQSNIQSNCFTGNDLTKWILDTFQDINTREEAVNLGNKLMNEGLFDRFSGKHPFEDRDLIYRISRDYQVSLPKARLPSISDVPELKEELSEAGEQLAAPPAGRSDGDWVIECNVCDGPIFNEHYHCSLCDQGDYDICTTCIMNGHHCLSESHVLTKRLVEDGKAISSSGEVHSCRDDGRKGSTRPKPQSRFNFESAGHPHTLTELYSDTKQDIKQAKLVDVPEMNALHRRLQIQRDRFIAWCLEWSDDNSAVSQGTIDNFIAQVGPTETVTSVIITIQDIIQQVDRIHASGDLGTLDAKGERNWASCTPAAKALYEDLAQDLTTSVDTLYDLSGARRDYDSSRAGPANEERFGTSHGDGRPADHESRSSVTSLSQLNTSAAEDEYIPESSTREREADIPEKAPPPFETIANSESTDIEIPGTDVEADVEGNLGDLGSFASSSRQSPRPRSPAIHTSTTSNPDIETTAPSASSTGGSASRMQHPNTLPTATKPASKRYIVTRKHSMSLISSSTSVLVFRDEYLDIVPSKKLNSNEPSIQKTISAHFSEVIGSKVTSKHPRSFKVVMYRGQRSKVYDFEANSVEEAAEIVKMIRDSVERCQDSSQRAINNIEAEILVPVGETEE
ncbi:hypothetical protein SLS56_001185 [Neofusicoccum ribis]|uniref:DEP domain-containing protein n=1 Tax=Neofusicoccum ribis TaxID=45134 RepID=A0ABR3TAM1_9PEZI